jgi:hypothetical protein
MRLGKFLALTALVVGALFAVTGSAVAAPVSGAIFTTDGGCNGTNVNIFGSKADVYLDGGPAHPGAAGLPDGEYYVQVTEPNGTVLGTSGIETVTVSSGEMECVNLFDLTGFADTSNPGGEYKVWASMDSTFPESASKTDNFKVKSGDEEGPDEGTLNVKKFYDANADGIKGSDADEPYITGWKVNIHDGINFDRFTPVSIILAADDYVVSEYPTVETNWIQTAGLLDGVAQNPMNPVNVTLADGDDKTVTFGNVCTVNGSGGLTLGFWSNKNGQALINSADLLALRNLNLVNATGSVFDPTTAAQVKSWLLSANATNMAYMLSAQLAATTLDVRHGFLSDSQLIYAPSLIGFSGVSSLGFTTIGNVRTVADAALLANPVTTAAGTARSNQEKLKNVLDGLNNNTVPFVSGTPCAFTFAS